MCLRSSVPCTLKDGQKDIITIKSNDRRGNMCRIAARPHLFFEKQFGFTMQRSVSKDHFATIVHSQLYRHRLHISSEDSWKDNSSPDKDNSRKSISVRQLTMLNMGSLSSNLKCQPPIAVFLALKLHSQTRSKQLVELLQYFHRIVAYMIVLSIEASFAKFIGTKARANSDVVCPTNLRHDIFSVAALDNKI